ncbi:MAG: DUF1501 domain-containing protein [Verrucomicrobiaceae bacterium]|nr:DUF1501 domain-containing protein [Verrucomicrobiaceae bacterium]
MHTPNIITRRSFLRRSALFAGAGAAAGTLRDMKLINSLMAADPPSDYKALVCVFLGGGNDANNWIVPTDNTTYGLYAAGRGNLVLPQASLLPLRTGPLGTDPLYDYQGRTYGFHPACTRLQTLWGEKKLAIIQNVGTLVRPTTKANYTSGLAAYRPPQLFSHSDQVTQWQTSIPDQPPTTGWGGRVADILHSISNPMNGISMNVSLNGANTLQIGNLVSQYHVSTAGAVVMNATGFGGGLMGTNGVRQKAMEAIYKLNLANLQRNAYADVLESAVENGETLNNSTIATRDPTDSPLGGYTNAQQVTAFNGTGGTPQTFKWENELTGIYNTALGGAFASGTGGFPNTTLGTQLKMIARLIAARGPSAFNMKRQIFYASAGGFDTHTAQVDGAGFTNQPTNANGTHYGLLRQVSEAMFAFQRAMEQLGISEKVVAFTASDFSRTFPSNSQGSDHGWGSHHIVVGGQTAVDGGKMFGTLPNFAVNGPDDTGTGRWIPTLSVDEHTATLAKWYGLGSGDITSVLPNLSRFNTSHAGGYIGFMKPA